MAAITWVLETAVFSDRYQSFAAAIDQAGHRRLEWSDDWWISGRWPRLSDETVVFHGSLGNASRVRQELPWKPGAFCDEERFRCSSWYRGAAAWLIHSRWAFSTVAELVADPRSIADSIGAEDQLFVRPDSPLKPFSGRVVAVDGLTLKKLDHGYYYDDSSLPIVVAPVRQVRREWRFVVARGVVVAGSEYLAEGRQAIGESDGLPGAFAQTIASELDAPELVYVLDVGECDGELRLLEVNPFSGADLYACDPESVVEAVAAAVLSASS